MTARALTRALAARSTLPPATWRPRHRLVLGVLWAHVAVLVVVAPLRLGPLPGLGAGLLLAILAAGAGLVKRPPLQAALAATGLLSCSAVLVQVAGSAVEAHLHYIVAIALLGLYEDGLLLGAAFGYVLLQHGVAAALDDRAALGGEPALGALGHAGFALAAVGVCAVSWRFNQEARHSRDDAWLALSVQNVVGHVLTSADDLESAAPQLLPVIGAGLGYRQGTLWLLRGETLHAEHAWPVEAPESRLDRALQVPPSAALREAAARRSGPALGLAVGDGPVAAGRHQDPEQPVRTLALPLVSASRRLVGVIELVGGPPGPDEPWRIELLNAVSLQLSAFVERLCRAQEADALERLALTDPLTALPNRRAWDTELQRQLRRAGREHAPLAVALLDLDHFKRFNDSQGHAAGDRLLVDAAGAWAAELRPGDLLVRIGGEEFAVLLPDCGRAGAQAVLDRLRAATPRAVTCSAGLAVWDGHEAAADLLARADRALYEAKEAGRDRTTVAAA